MKGDTTKHRLSAWPLLTFSLFSIIASPLFAYKIKPAAILSQISKLKSEGIGPDNAETMATGPPGSKKVRHQRRLADLYSQYQQGLVQSNALDFDDIILVALKMLKENQGGLFIFSFLFFLCNYAL